MGIKPRKCFLSILQSFTQLKVLKLTTLGEGSAEELGIKVIDEKTIEVTLEAPTPYFLELTAFKTYVPNSQSNF